MKSVSRELLDRSVLAMAAAIEIYNKPGLPYRNESFTILAVNGWELLLKSRWLVLNKNRKSSLYVYEHRKTSKGTRSARRYIKRTRSRTPFTHDLSYLAEQLANQKFLDNSARKNLGILLEFRDSATHFYSQSPAFGTRLYEIGAACVKNFVNTVQDWFGRDLSEFNLHLMPLTFLDLAPVVHGTLLNAEEHRFLEFLESMDEPDADPASRFSVTVNVAIRFTKSKARDALSVRVTRDPSALPVNLTEEDIRERYPWDYTTLTERCKQIYGDFKVNSKYHEIRGTLQTDDRFGHMRLLDPRNSESSRKLFFNPNIMTEFDKHYTRK